jgi:hypothetical protein
MFESEEGCGKGFARIQVAEFRCAVKDQDSSGWPGFAQQELQEADSIF